MEYSAYIVTNELTDRQYIGITSKGIFNRWKAHLLKTAQGSSLYFHRCIREYGEKNFTIKHIASSKTWDDLLELEKILIKQYNTFTPHGYNLTKGGNGGLGYKFTQEQLKRLSESHIGYKYTDEAMERRRKLNLIRFPIEKRKVKLPKMSEQEKKSWHRAMFKKLIENPEFSKKWIGAHAGKKHSNVAKEKMAKSRNDFIQKNPRSGELSGKLTLENVSRIKTLLFFGKSQTSIGKEFGIRQTQVSNIKNELCWKNVFPEPYFVPLFG